MILIYCVADSDSSFLLNEIKERVIMRIFYCALHDF